MRHHRDRSGFWLVELWIWLGLGLVWRQVGLVLVLLEGAWEGRTVRIVLVIVLKWVFVSLFLTFEA
jgi:hypothetical protein